MIDPQRVRGGLALLERHPEINILVCDDGLQHLPLHRDIEVIVFDERGQGNGWQCPPARCEKPLSTSAPSGLAAPPIVLYNASQPSTHLPGHCVRKNTAPLVELSHWWLGASAKHSSALP